MIPQVERALIDLRREKGDGSQGGMVEWVPPTACPSCGTRLVAGSDRKRFSAEETKMKAGNGESPMSYRLFLRS